MINVKPTSPFPYFQLGCYISQILVQKNKDCFIVSEDIDLILNLVPKFNFKLSKPYIDRLIKFKNSLDCSRGKNLSDPLISELHNITEDISTVLLTEIKHKLIFQPSERRLDIYKCLFNISSLFAPEIYKNLPKIAQYDFSEGAKCIVFGLSTSCAFHLSRGLESILRALFSKISHKEVHKEGWGLIIKEIRSTNENDLNILLDHLDNIRKNYRNPTNHPEKIYNIYEAEDLFMETIGLTNRIVDFLLKKYGDVERKS